MEPTAAALAAILGDDVYGHVVIVARNRFRAVKAGDDVLRPVLAARYERGWSRAEAARQLGVSREVLTRLEEGRGVYPANALKVAEGYGLDVFELVPDPTKEENGAPVPA